MHVARAERSTLNEQAYAKNEHSPVHLRNVRARFVFTSLFISVKSVVDSIVL